MGQNEEKTKGRKQSARSPSGYEQERRENLNICRNAYQNGREPSKQKKEKYTEGDHGCEKG